MKTGIGRSKFRNYSILTLLDKSLQFFFDNNLYFLLIWLFTIVFDLLLDSKIDCTRFFEVVLHLNFSYAVKVHYFSW